MSNQTVKRESLLLRYSTALERGDFDTITTILEIAEGDTVLGHMIETLNEAYFHEIVSEHGLLDRSQTRTSVAFPIIGTESIKNNSANRHIPLTKGIPLRRPSHRLSVGLVAALLAATLFMFVFYKRSQQPSRHTDVPIPWSGKIAMMTTSRSEHKTTLYVISSRDVTPMSFASFVGKLAEATGQVDWSPDGAQIAVTTCEHGLCDLYVINGDGTNLRKLGTNVADFSWASDSHQLVFSNVDGQLFLTKDSGEQRLLLKERIHSSYSYPSWSPDGRRIAFLSNENNGEIYVIDADGDNLRVLAQNVHDAVPIWAPDARKLALIVSDSVVIVDADNAQQHMVVDGMKHNLGTLGRTVKWSPDGKILAFFTDRQDLQREFYVVDTRSQQLRRLAQVDNSTSAFAWSPDGSQLTISGQCNGAQGVQVITLDGSKRQCLTSFSNVSGLNVDWTS